jgi:glycosyltransferase involved in cell wall biosynthesis
MKKKKILLIGPMPPPSGGVSVHLRRLLERSKNREDLEFAVYDARKQALFRNGRKMAGIVPAILFFFSCDIVHLHLSHPSKVFLARVGRRFGKKVFYTQHNPREQHTEETKKMILLSEVVLFVFDPGTLPPNGRVLTAYLPPTGGPAAPAVLPDEPEPYDRVIVSLSSFSGSEADEDTYGFDRVIDAYSRLAPGHAAALVLVDTNGKLKKRYAPAIDAINGGVSGKIFFITTEIDFPALLARASLFVRATRTDGDSLSVREALAAGIPVLASDCVKRPEGCILFSSGDARDLTKKMESALEGGERKYFVQPDVAAELFDLYSGQGMRGGSH